MTLISPTLAAIPALVTLAIAAGRVVVPLAREVRLVTVAWLALRRTRPDERAEIIRALMGEPQQGLVNDKSARRPPERSQQYLRLAFSARRAGQGPPSRSAGNLADLGLVPRPGPTVPRRESANLLQREHARRKRPRHSAPGYGITCYETPCDRRHTDVLTKRCIDRQLYRQSRCAFLSHAALADMLCHRRGENLEARASQAEAGPVSELRGFSKGLRKDWEAVTAGFTVSYSSGAVEGHVNF